MLKYENTLHDFDGSLGLSYYRHGQLHRTDRPALILSFWYGVHYEYGVHIHDGVQPDDHTPNIILR